MGRCIRNCCLKAENDFLCRETVAWVGKGYEANRTSPEPIGVNFCFIVTAAAQMPVWKRNYHREDRENLSPSTCLFRSKPSKFGRFYSQVNIYGIAALVS